MPMGPPLMKAEQNRAIRVENLTEVVVGRGRFCQAKQSLVPRDASRIQTVTSSKSSPAHMAAASRLPWRRLLTASCQSAILAVSFPARGSNGIRSIAAPRIHHAARLYSGRVAARGARAAAGDAAG